MKVSTLFASLIGCLTALGAEAASPSFAGSFTSPDVLSTVVVTARPGWLDEEQLIGETQRPEWTSRRRFGTTRTYIQYEPWEVAVEQWWRVRSYRNNGKTARQLFMQEIALGLPHRMQLDLYYDWAHEEGRTRNKDVAVELRWALADWGVLPLNPTLYAEYKATDGAYGSDVWETKLLLGTDLAPRLHWAFNAVYERECSRSLETEIALTQGLSYTVVDQKLSAGVEMQYKHQYSPGHTNIENKFQVGPSVQYNPTRNSWINIVALGGCTADSPALEAFVVLGYNFGKGAGGRTVSRPTSAPR
jgi:hypothetical protein